MPTGINYLDETWNMILGCGRKSAGCKNCWAEAVSHVHANHPNPKISSAYEGITKDGKWTGKVKCLEDRLDQPRHWRKPRVVGVSFMGDIANPHVPFEFIDKVFARMVAPECQQHTFLMLTKLPKRMLEYITREETRGMIAGWLKTNFFGMEKGKPLYEPRQYYLNDSYWPIPNVWLGVSVESPEHYDRIDILRQVPAAKRFISLEPALAAMPDLPLDGISLVIYGGESGPGYRPMDLQWPRDVRDQCKAAGVPFFFKQTAGKGLIPSDLLIREWPQ